MNKWDAWWDNLPLNTQEYLKNQPIWHDSDMWRAGLVGFVIGLIFGLAF
jgi:hypothetical protein